MIRNKFLNKLRKKYQMGGLSAEGRYRNPLIDPYISVGSRNIQTDFGSRAGFGAKLSIPFVQRGGRYGYYKSLRGETDFVSRYGGREGIGELEAQLGPNHPAVRDGLPEYMNTEPKTVNAAIGLRGIYNKNIGNLTMRSNIGAGIGTGDYAGDYYKYNPNAFGDIELSGGSSPSTPGAPAKPYVDANVGLMRRTKSLANRSIPTAIGGNVSYGTRYAPNPGLRVGVTGSAGPLTGGVGYDVTNNAFRAGVGLSFQKGGVRVNIPRNYNIPTPPPQAVVKPKDTSIASRLNNLAGKITNFSMAPGGAPEGGNEAVKVMTELTGVPSALRLAQSYKNVANDPSKQNIKDFALNTLGTIPVAKAVTGATRSAGPLLSMADDALTAYGRTKIGAVLKGNKAADIVMRQMGGMYDQPQMMRKGGKALPGGMMKPIPGSDAVEFKGRSHEEGGIMVDPQTEVEGGETMDQVNMAKKGGKRDYFFSSFLKKGGRSFAQMHKDILRKGGDQEDINMLAKMQEKAAGRNPKKVARLGGVVEYKHGGIHKYEEGGIQKRYDEHEANKPTFNLTPPTPPRKKRNPNKIQEKQYRDALAQYNKDLAEYNAAKQQYESDLAEWETIENELSDELEQEEMLREAEEREAQEKADEEQARKDARKAENDALIQEAKDLGIPLPEGGAIQLNELKSLIKRYKEDAKLDKKRKGEKSFLPGTEGIPETQPAVTIGGKQYFLDDPELQQFIESEGENFGDTWMSNVDPEVLEAAGIKSFEDLQDPKNVLKYQQAYNAKYPDRKIEDDGLLGEETLNTGMPTTIQKTLPEVKIVAERDKDPLPLLTPTIDIQPIPVELPEPELITVPEAIPPSEFMVSDLDDDERRGIPREAYLGMAAGLLPAAYAYFHKQPPAEQAGYTQGFRSPVIAQRGKAPKLERYDYNQDIANVGADVRGMNKYIETSGGGPANMINKMMAFSKGQDAKMKIRAAETRANIGVQNTEAQLEQQMTLDNMRRAQQASIFNAQMSRAEAARMDQIDEANTARRQKRIDDQEFMKYSGISTAGTLLQQSFGDILDYKADMAKAEAIGTGAGNVSRDAALIAAGYSLDESTGVWSPTKNKFGGLKRLLNYKK